MPGYGGNCPGPNCPNFKSNNNEQFTTAQAAAEIIQKLNTITIVLVLLLAMNAYSFMNRR